jgi:hypothetical protein
MEVNTIKVKFTQNWRFNGITYGRDAVLEIAPEDFNSCFMEKIVETPITEVVTVASQEPILPHVEVSPPDETKPKPRRVTKRDY